MKKTLSIFSLAMINVAAVGTVKNWPLIAESGFATVFYLILSALTFFIPMALISAELATGWPKLGGIYVWVKEAFGHRAGFLAAWLFWVENLFWYPTILSFIAASIAYIINPDLASNKTYTIIIMLSFFWATTLVNLLGMKISSAISSISVIAGSFLPGALIIGLGFAWYFGGNPLQIDLSMKSFLPDLASPEQLVVFVGILLTLSGIEMSAVHAMDVKNPQRDYPRSILLSVSLILGLSILGVLAISIVVPKETISLVAGSLQAFQYFVGVYHLGWLTPYIAFLIAVGAVGSMSTWIVGPTKSLLAAAKYGDLPPLFRKVNKHGMPHTLLITQAIIVSCLSLAFLLMPTINSAYWMISVIVIQLYLIMYFLMVGAAIRLRYSRPNVPRAYKIPGGNAGMWIIGTLGFLSSLCALIIGFFRPTQIAQENYFFYVCCLSLAIIGACLAPIVILFFQKPHWKQLLKHEKNED